MINFLANSGYALLSVFSLVIIVAAPVAIYYILFKESKARGNSFRKTLSESSGTLIVSSVLFIFALMFFIEGISRGKF